jgi:hypothetical protein
MKSVSEFVTKTFIFLVVVITINLLKLRKPKRKFHLFSAEYNLLKSQAIGRVTLVHSTGRKGRKVDFHSCHLLQNSLGFTRKYP